jgi:hypothetical protein
MQGAGFSFFPSLSFGSFLYEQLSSFLEFLFLPLGYRLFIRWLFFASFLSLSSFPFFIFFSEGVSAAMCLFFVALYYHMYTHICWLLPLF